jgi:hypothetical protein
MSEHRVETPAGAGWEGVRGRLAWLADLLVVAVALALPWSTAATSILLVLWLIVLLPTLDAAAIRRELFSAAGALPALLWLLAALGMLWAEVGWSDRIHGLDAFHKLLMIPLLLAQFRRSGNGQWVLVGFLVSSAVLLLVSWGLALVPGLAWRGKTLGVPVKDYILQSAVFAVCGFGLIGQAVELWRRAARFALAMLVGAVLFIANSLCVATARTTLITMAVLAVLFGGSRFGWRGALGASIIGVMVVGVTWSPCLREPVSPTIEQALRHGSGDLITSVGLRFEYWRKSLSMTGEALVLGHGTGTIPMLFRRDATPATHPMLLTDNPHNQVLTVAIQLGFIGAFVLIAMWLAHVALFSGAAVTTAWFGLVIVAQNIVGSMFNSHLSDFAHGWLYVIGVGVIGGMVLRATQPACGGSAA